MFSFLSFVIFVFLFFACFYAISRWSFVDVPLIFSGPADHVPEWQPRSTLYITEYGGGPIGYINVKSTHINTYNGGKPQEPGIA